MTTHHVFLKRAVAAAIAGVLAASAAAPAYAQRATRSAPPTVFDEGQRMIVPGGQSVPSYLPPNGCVTDDGYGRIKPCDAGDGGN